MSELQEWCEKIVNRKLKRLYLDMVKRCESLRYKEEFPTYKECALDTRWSGEMGYINFTTWIKVQVGFNYLISNQKWSLDKDILVKGNKLYSPDTCVLVPQKLNNFFTDCTKNRGKYLVGVSLDKTSGKFRPHISVDGKNKHLGRYASESEAYEVYLEEKHKQALDWVTKLTSSSGEFIVDEKVIKILKNYKNLYAIYAV